MLLLNNLLWYCFWTFGTFRNIINMLVFFLIAANTMDNLKTPFKGVLDDVKGRLACYKKDWLDTCGSGARCISFRLFLMEGGVGGGVFLLLQSINYNLIFIVLYLFRILAPTAYIFFASALPVIAFGEQLSRETGQYI